MGKRRARARRSPAHRRGGGLGAAPGFEKLLTPRQVGAVLGFDERTVLRRCKRGEMRHQRFGKRAIRIAPSALADYIKTNTHGGGGK